MTSHKSKRSATADDLLTRLGRLTAQAREGAELHQARVELAEALQREILPASLPALPGLRTAARYAPARHGLSVGGDWYDGFRLPSGALGFSIGDVEGHDVEAAAFMGQVRIAVRAVAASAADPGEVLRRANELLLSVDCDLFATCTFVRFDPVNWEIQSARAGHVPGVWATTGGEYGVVEDEGGLPLGMLSGSEYPVTRLPLTTAGSFVLVTDGVVEGPSFPIEAGLARVAEVIRAGVGADPGDLAAEVMKVADSTGHEDDAAVLVLRHEGGPPPDRTTRPAP
ncbi:PP2C family protein-serine/threonine phosphatase [Streptomyces antarcticus]|uniref:PP2C family protein-serine/threonine phosphatase n=1 Tax=Streptomyces antarcticus TaxID=2996458 RepID=UPI00226F7E8D|nr:MULTISPECIES: PP2C family protein-serine/threonine phosphatase [unclassified Streptomyces]MCY0943064.1 PP2C family protein-serine/threonine phosphatase [Streptomyces sp. H34-AA3]MCY0949757.1 PP2C family protein-serine/threonine phosphatase [Streptomyces sp. H27-S2]MCZ4084425.1 PP2C family protein-serine/threonine phosphatase [Streptomyces sp. H34-S5]